MELITVKLISNRDDCLYHQIESSVKVYGYHFQSHICSTNIEMWTLYIHDIHEFYTEQSIVSGEKEIILLWTIIFKTLIP